MKPYFPVYIYIYDLFFCIIYIYGLLQPIFLYIFTCTAYYSLFSCIYLHVQPITAYFPVFIFISYFYSTTKHEILQISNHNLLCSLDPPNQGRLLWVVGPKLINDTEYNWLHISSYVWWVRSCLEGRRLSGYLWQGDQRDFYVDTGC